MLTSRSRARAVALQLLYQRDQNRTIDRETIEKFTRDRLRQGAMVPFCLALYDGVLTHAEDIDRRLSEAAENWKLTRMTVVDRNVLRLGAFELLHTPETPPKVAFDEAIELARRYGSADSPAFVNGVLDKLLQTAMVPPAAETASPTDGG